MGSKPDDYRPPQSAEELLERYARGERDFSAHKVGRANLCWTNLFGANLFGANLFGADLRGADLRGANLGEANLQQADLTGADLRGANLGEADLTRANLEGANLYGAHLYGADLTGVSLSGADLSGANLTEANLFWANLNGAHVYRTNLTRAEIDYALLLDIHLTEPCLQGVVLDIRCTVDHRSIARSLDVPRDKLTDFLVRTGMPRLYADYAIDSLKALSPSELFSMLQTTFISYGTPDEGFARRLHKALQAEGVTTFFYPEHAPPGMRHGRLMRRGVNEYERTILICSEASLIRSGVAYELQQILEREADEGGSERLIPVRIDDAVLGDGWAKDDPGLRKQVQGRVIVDFSPGQDFNRALGRLLQALRTNRPPGLPVGQ